MIKFYCKLFIITFYHYLILTPTLSYPQTSTQFNVKKLAQITNLPGVEASNIWGTKIAGVEYAIVGSKTATNIYDVSNCAAPILKTSIFDGSNTSWREYKSYKNFVYGVTEAGGEGLEMFNLTSLSPSNNAVSFTQVTSPSDSFFYSAHSLYIDTATARMYVNGARPFSGSTTRWTYIYQLSPNNIKPTLLRKYQFMTQGSNPIPLYTHDAYVIGNIFYGSHGNDGFYMWDVSDPQNISFLKENNINNIGTGLDGYNHSSWRHPNYPQYLYCAEETAGQHMIIYETSGSGTNTNIVQQSAFKHPLGAPTYNNVIYHNPHAKGNELYISAYNDGIQIYDISNPINPIRAAYYDSYPSAPTATSGYTGFFGAWGVYPYFDSGCHVVSDINTGFHTFKLHFPKVEIGGNLHIIEPDKGIVFKDSNNVYKVLKVDNTGKLLVNNVTITNAEHKVDSADVEILDFANAFYLTSINGSKYQVKTQNDGSFSTTLVAPTSITNAIQISGHLVINNIYKGIITKSPNGQRWKTVILKNSTTFINHKTTF